MPAIVQILLIIDKTEGCAFFFLPFNIHLNPESYKGISKSLPWLDVNGWKQYFKLLLLVDILALPRIYTTL